MPHLDADKVVSRNHFSDLQKTGDAVEGKPNLHCLVHRESTKPGTGHVMHLHPCTKAGGMSHIPILVRLGRVCAAVIRVGAEPGLEGACRDIVLHNNVGAWRRQLGFELARANMRGKDGLSGTAMECLSVRRHRKGRLLNDDCASPWDPICKD